MSEGPYPGPRPFDVGDDAYFRGRAREVRDLASLLASYRLVLLYSQSGAGKSSLVNAGLRPRLQAGIRPASSSAGRRARSDTVAAKLRGIQVLAARVSGARSEDLPRDGGTNIHVRNVLATLAASAAADWGPDVTLARSLPGGGASGGTAPQDEVAELLVLDQFEEIFTAYPDRWREREDFFQQLAAALESRPRLRVLLVMREEYLASIERFASLFTDGFRVRYRLERLRPEEAVQAVREPAREAVRAALHEADTRRSADVRAVARAAAAIKARARDLVRNLQRVPHQTSGGQAIVIEGEFVEPLHLQVVCQTWWRQLTGQTRTAGAAGRADELDVDTVLEQFYTGALAEASEAVPRTALGSALAQVDALPYHLVPWPAAWPLRWLIDRYATPDLHEWVRSELLTSAGTRSQVYLDEQSGKAGGMPVAYVQALERAHVLRLEPRAGTSWYELTHDRFILAIQRVEAARQQTARRAEKVGLAVSLAAMLGIALFFGLWAKWNADSARRLTAVQTQQQQAERAAQDRVAKGVELLRNDDPQGAELVRQALADNQAAALAAVLAVPLEPGSGGAFVRGSLLRLLVPSLQRDDVPEKVKQYVCRFPVHVVATPVDPTDRQVVRLQEAGLKGATLADAVASSRPVYVEQFVACADVRERFARVRSLNMTPRIEAPLAGVCGPCQGEPDIPMTSASLSPRRDLVAAKTALQSFKVGVYYLRTSQTQAARAEALEQALRTNGFRGPVQIYPVTRETMKAVLTPTADQVRYDYGEEAPADALVTLLGAADPDRSYQKLLTGSGTRNFLSIFFKPEP